MRIRLTVLAGAEEAERASSWKRLRIHASKKGVIEPSSSKRIRGHYTKRQKSYGKAVLRKPIARSRGGNKAKQVEVRQLEGLALDKTFTDKASGKDMKRPQLEACRVSSAKAIQCFVTRWTGWPATSLT